jgi:hypothetical protein
MLYQMSNECCADRRTAHAVQYAVRYCLSGWQYSQLPQQLQIIIRPDKHLHAADSACLPAVFEQLAAAGVGVYAYDMHGHGLSEPQELAGRALLLDWHHLVGCAAGVPGGWNAALAVVVYHGFSRLHVEAACQ